MKKKRKITKMPRKPKMIISDRPRRRVSNLSVPRAHSRNLLMRMILRNFGTITWPRISSSVTRMSMKLWVTILEVFHTSHQRTKAKASRSLKEKLMISISSYTEIKLRLWIPIKIGCTSRHRAYSSREGRT